MPPWPCVIGLSRTGSTRSCPLYRSKRKGDSRDGSTLVKWEDVSPTLSTSALSSVDLQGMSRRLRVSADDGSNVFVDVDTINSTIA
jgi:hypothetical protein